MNKRLKRTKKAQRSGSMLIVGFILLSSLALAGCAETTSPNLDIPPVELRGDWTPTPPASSTIDPGTLNDAFAELELEDQSGDGSRVQVEEIRIGFDIGFIGIFDLEGNLMGYAKVTSQSQPVSVSLDTPVVASMELLGKLYADNGDGKFDPATDPAVLDDDREMVFEAFDYRLSNK